MTQTANDVLARYPGAGRDALIPILQEVQEVDGYLSKEAVVAIGKHLNLPTSKIYGVATFYNQFRFVPKGKHHIMVCRGTACHVKGSAKVLDTLTQLLRIGPGETTRDRLFSIEVVACIGACGLAPVLNVDGEFHGGMTPDKITRLVNKLRKEETVHATSE